MPIFNIRVGACDMGQVEASSEQHARNLAARLVGCEDEAELKNGMEEPAEVVAQMVE